MKHKLAITLIILTMFLLTQFIGLFVISSDAVPTYLKAPLSQEEQTSYGYYFFQILTSFIFAIILFVLITKYKLVTFMRIWFFTVLFLAISISLFAILKLFNIEMYWLALIIALPLVTLKVLRPSVIIHNGTELLVYPGIAAIFVQILSPLYVILLLIFISLYDLWAVWHSGIMQKMAKFQMQKMKMFGGFFIPYLTKEIRIKIKAMKKKFKGKELKNKGLKIPIAILGGGDIVFPIITAGVFMNSYGVGSALGVIFGAFGGLTLLLLLSHKRKYYPAMIYITPGIFLGLLCWALLRII